MNYKTKVKLNGGYAGGYANYFRVGQNDVEFVIDFGQRYAKEKVARYHTRIILNPVYAKELIEMLSKAYKHYQEG